MRSTRDARAAPGGRLADTIPPITSRFQTAEILDFSARLGTGQLRLADGALLNFRDHALRVSSAEICAAIEAVVLAMFLGPTASAFSGAVAGLLVGLGWVAPALTCTFLFERRPRRLLAIDAGYHVVTFALMGTILGAWP